MLNLLKPKPIKKFYEGKTERGKVMAKAHELQARLVWTGNRGEGTKNYKGYDRTWDLAVPGKATVSCSNDPLLGGDPSKYNPEDLLIAAVASCHMLWYLHLCANAGITVLAYEDFEPTYVPSVSVDQ